MITKEQLIRNIPRWKSGKKMGEPKSKKLRELVHQLQKYKFSPEDLDYIARQIDFEVDDEQT